MSYQYAIKVILSLSFMKVSTKFSNKGFFSVIHIAARFLEDIFMCYKDSTCISYHIYPKSMGLMLVFILEAPGSSRFHILDSLTNNFFLTILLIVIFLINFVLSAGSSTEYLKFSNKCSQTEPNFCRC